MRFLAPSECEEFPLQIGLDRRDLVTGKRVYKLKNAADFFYQSRMKNARSVTDHLVDFLSDFTWAMVWAYALPLGDRSREDNAPDDWRRYTLWRRSAGEARALYEAPGHLFEPNERSKLADAIEFAIYTGWDAIVLARPLRCIMTL